MRNRLFVPWKGTMLSLDLATRQKIVRILSSAAVCGLSISFIIGEAIDHKAKQISQWKVEPNFFPADYLPIHPVINGLAAISPAKVKDGLVALNSSPVSTQENLAKEEKAPAYKDSIRAVLAAP